MTDFGDIRGFHAWKNKLEELLVEAERLGEEDDFEARQALAASFVDFIVGSTPNTPEILSLDRIANQARKSILTSAIDNRLQSLADRRQELLLLTKEVAVASDAAKDAASSLRLERAREVVTSLTATIRSVKEFKEALKDGEDVSLAQPLEKLVESLKQTRDTIENKT